MSRGQAPRGYIYPGMSGGIVTLPDIVLCPSFQFLFHSRWAMRSQIE